MNDANVSQGKLGELLRTNKLAIFLEIAVVFVPMYVLLLINNRLGHDFVSLGGSVKLVGGPLVYLGMILGLVAVWGTSRIRGCSWGDYGLARPKSWIRTILMGVGAAIVYLVVAVVLGELIKLVFPNAGTQDLSRFDPLRGNLPNLILNVVVNAWFTAGFVEEFLWRGYLMNRLADLQGKRTTLAWAIALVGSAVIFGLGHTYQGAAGVIKIAIAGLVLGGIFLAVRRNLWPLVIVHVLIDTWSFVQHFLDV